ncbi:hypothetical protein DENSPDRAFT_853705 [Dentipellis sp. KUC8613]|nr:hypothetical protein DENSPDRAFT_853705 [Dentipellis sp. KUC8613]
MAYPNSPEGLPRTLYTDMSSLHIASPRAGYADGNPYKQERYVKHSDLSARPQLPPDLYSGMASMQISSPYRGPAILPSGAQCALVSPVDPLQDFSRPGPQSSYTYTSMQCCGNNALAAGLRKYLQDQSAPTNDAYMKTEDEEEDYDWGVSYQELMNLPNNIEKELEAGVARDPGLLPLLEHHRYLMRSGEQVKQLHHDMIILREDIKSLRQ